MADLNRLGTRLGGMHLARLLARDQTDLDKVKRADKAITDPITTRARDRVAQRHHPVMLKQDQRRGAATEGRLETPRAAGVAGLAFSVLFTTSILLGSHPASGSTAAEIQEFYLRENAGRIALVGVYLAPFAGIAFLWFIAVSGT
jgi:hypothetical protein